MIIFCFSGGVECLESELGGRTNLNPSHGFAEGGGRRIVTTGLGFHTYHTRRCLTDQMPLVRCGGWKMTSCFPPYKENAPETRLVVEPALEALPNTPW